MGIKDCKNEIVLDLVQAGMDAAMSERSKEKA